MNYKIDVVGYTWEGHKASYSKMFEEKLAPEELKFAFGDFQEISDFRITSVETVSRTEGNKYITTKTEEVITPFKNSDYELGFMY
jgi:hypothetical protein